MVTLSVAYRCYARALCMQAQHGFHMQSSPQTHWESSAQGMQGKCVCACREVFGMAQLNSTAQTELQALFDIIGTPHWADVEALHSPAWRKYLQRLPGKAPTLYRCFCLYCVVGWSSAVQCSAVQCSAAAAAVHGAAWSTLFNHMHCTAWGWRWVLKCSAWRWSKVQGLELEYSSKFKAVHVVGLG